MKVSLRSGITEILALRLDPRRTDVANRRYDLVEGLADEGE